MSLTERSVSAAKWTMAASVVRACAQVVQLIVLTKFLSPKDYGLMAMVMVAISYAALFSDMGLSTAFVQRKEISQEERSSLYWLSIVMGASLMVLMLMISPLISGWVDEPELSVLIALVSTNFFTASLGQQLRLEAEKLLDFRPVACIEIVAATSGLSVALCAAMSGWKVYSLVAASICSTWVSMALSWALLAKGWRPLFRFRLSEVRWFVQFGGGMVVNNLINQVNSTIDIVLGGRLLGVSQIGLYSVPRNLILQVQSLVNPVFTRVGFPVIASVQHDRARVRKVYLQIMSLTSAVNAPIYIFAAVFAPEFVQLFFSPSYLGVAPLLRILAVWGLFRSFSNPVGSLLFGLGLVKRSILWNLGCLFVVGFALWVASNHGVKWLAWAMTASMSVLFIPAWALLVRPACGAGFGEYAKSVIVPVAGAGTAAILAWLLVADISILGLRFVAGVTFASIAYVLIMFALKREVVIGILSMVNRNSILSKR